jgi:hypothetical protein
VTANKKKRAKGKRQANRPGRAPAGRAGRRPATRRPAARRLRSSSGKITLVASVIEVLRLVWEIGQKIGW